MMATQIVTGTPDGGLKLLLQAKRASEATINFVMGTNIGTLNDFVA